MSILNNDIPIGTMLMCTGNKNEFNEKWLVCDGTEYDNIDGKFNILLEMNIGYSYDNIFKSPDYGNMTFIKSTDPHYEQFKNNFDKSIKYSGHYHHNNDYFKNSKSNLLTNKIFIDCLHNRDCENCINNKIYWIVKYNK